MGPGWFADPWRLAPWRWWDGYQWTPYTWPGRELVDARRKEASLHHWAKLGLIAMIVSAVGTWVSSLTIAHAFRSTVDQFGQNPYGPPPVFSPDSTAWFALSYLIPGVTAGVAVVFLVWQHSAATVARSLGYPARISPALGVGSWFIPIVNFWFPYQSLSDMLPPDHPMRPLCLRAWLAWIGVTAIDFVAFFLAFASTTAAVLAMAVAGLLLLYAFVTGRRLVDAVYLDHTYRLTQMPY